MSNVKVSIIVPVYNGARFLKECLDSLLGQTLEGVARAEDSLAAGITPDALLTDVEEALSALGELTGANLREDITARIFERFCVGK